MPFLAASLLLTACAEDKTINGVTYEPFGLVTESDKRNPEVEYKVDWPNVVCAVIFFETIIVPIYVFGWALQEPRGMKNTIKGAAPVG